MTKLRAVRGENWLVELPELKYPIDLQVVYRKALMYINSGRKTRGLAWELAHGIVGQHVKLEALFASTAQFEADLHKTRLAIQKLSKQTSDEIKNLTKRLAECEKRHGVTTNG